MPNGELKQMQKDMEDLKDDISDLKYTLLNPDNGVIVNTNKNSEFREAMQAGDKDFQLKLLELQELKRWKEGVTKALWILFTGLAGVIIKLLSEAVKNG
jgi:hypothetical protein